VTWLLVLRRFPDGSHSGLAEVLALALVHVEPLLNIVPCRFDRHQAGGKLHVAVLADAEQGMVSHELKFSLCHDSSLRRLRGHSRGPDFKLHHYPGFGIPVSRMPRFMRLCGTQSPQETSGGGKSSVLRLRARPTRKEADRKFFTGAPLRMTLHVHE